MNGFHVTCIAHYLTHIARCCHFFEKPKHQKLTSWRCLAPFAANQVMSNSQLPGTLASRIGSFVSTSNWNGFAWAAGAIVLLQLRMFGGKRDVCTMMFFSSRTFYGSRLRSSPAQKWAWDDFSLSTSFHIPNPHWSDESSAAADCKSNFLQQLPGMQFSAATAPSNGWSCWAAACWAQRDSMLHTSDLEDPSAWKKPEHLGKGVEIQKPHLWL